MARPRMRFARHSYNRPFIVACQPPIPPFASHKKFSAETQNSHEKRPNNAKAFWPESQSIDIRRHPRPRPESHFTFPKNDAFFIALNRYKVYIVSTMHNP